MDMERLTEARRKIKIALAEAGPDNDFSRVECLEGSTPKEKVAALAALNDEVDQIEGEHQQHIESRQTGGHPLPVGGARRSLDSPTPGWKPGHWGDSFEPQIQGGLISTGTVTVPALSGGIVPIEDRPLSLLELIPVENLADTDQFAYLRETAREHKAAPTAKSTKKPESKYQVKKIEGTAQTVAHISEPVARQDLEDTNLLRGYIDGSMRRGVQLGLEAQILEGEGEEAELTGISETEGIEEQGFAEGPIITARKAVKALEDEEIMGGVFVMGTEHWQEIELTRTNDGIFVGSAPGEIPVDRMRKRLWGKPVVTTTLLEGKVGYLVDFAGSTKLWERGGVRVDWSEAPEGSVEEVSAFKSNELIFRGEGRWGFGVTRPSGVVKVSLQA